VTISVLPETMVLFLLSFARLGTLMMFLPALGEQNIPTRIRLALALTFSFVLYPVLAARYPGGLLDDPPTIGLYFFGEMLVGAFIGLATRMVMAALQIAGTTISYQSSMAMAQSFDPTAGSQGALIGSFLSVLGIAVIFAMDVHHLAIMALHDSYLLFPPGDWLPVGDATQVAVQGMGGTFKLGVNLAAPFLVFGIVFNLGIGLLNRLMPQVQIFFIAMPANVGIALLILMATLGTIMLWYVDHIRMSIAQFIGS